jgi:hypothetical protein
MPHPQLHVKYAYKLYELNCETSHFVEAAYALLIHAEQLNVWIFF